MTIDYKAHSLLIRTFARANPVFFQDLLEKLEAMEELPLSEELAERVLGDTARSGFLGNVGENGNSPAQTALIKVYDDRAPKVTPVYHIFPTWNENFTTGLMVPLAVESAEDWHVSDAFGKFEFINDPSGSPFMGLLKILEKEWADLYGKEKILPLRWRKSFNLRILCPVHLEAITGESLHVPLIIAVLRGLAITMDTSDALAQLPFGNCPVFATGELYGDNTFGRVYHVKEKLQGFIREYGTGLPAILQKAQVEELSSSGLLEKVSVYEADSIRDLFRIPELQKCLHQLTKPPHTTEIDYLLGLMNRSKRSLRFGDVANMANWLLPSIKSPVYQFQLHRYIGQMHAHNGMFIAAQPKVLVCQKLTDNNSSLFGLSDQCNLTTMVSTLAFDSANPALANGMLDKLEPHASNLPIAERVAFWGSRCQIYRLDGQDDLAVEAGRKAVQFADLGRAGDSGRDRNYLIHSLLARAKRNNAHDSQQQDLSEVAELIQESKTIWVPRDDVSNRRSHLGFCLHYEAELARLNKRSFSPPDQPPWKGDWGHAWNFTLLSCARNAAHDTKLRLHFINTLVGRFNDKKIHSDSLYFLIYQVYRIYKAYLNNAEWADHLRQLEDWCGRMEGFGFPGWHRRLRPDFNELKKGNGHAVEQLCDSIPYH